MPKWVFTGTVYPERAWFGIEPLLQLQSSFPDFDTRISAVLSIGVSKISCVVNTDSEVDLWTLRNMVDQLVAGVVDAAGYLMGRGYDLEIEAATNPETGEHTVFGVSIPILEATTSDREIPLLNLLELSGGSPPLARALADLRRAAREPSDTGFYCYRASEGLKHHWRLTTDTPAGRAGQWAEMRTALNVDRSVYDLFKVWADRQRHGEHAAITDADRGTLLSLAWGVVYRFCLMLQSESNVRPSDLERLTA
jgi:hypothetical protein